MPDDIWSMDMRAGGATEAGKLVGVSMMDLQAAGGWTDPKMPARYTRDRVTRAQNVVRLRQARRENGSEQNIGTDRNTLTGEGKKANRNN